MNNRLAEFIRAKQIDSCQKLRLLLFIYQNTDLSGTTQELGHRLYFGHTPLLEKILLDLQTVGLIERIDDHYRVRNEPELPSTLQRLAHTLEDPLARQEILDEIRHGVKLNHPPEITGQLSRQPV